MKTKEDVFQDKCGFGAISDNTSISIAKRDIYPAMEEYAIQKQIELLTSLEDFLPAMVYEDKEIKLKRILKQLEK